MEIDVTVVLTVVGVAVHFRVVVDMDGTPTVLETVDVI